MKAYATPNLDKIAAGGLTMRMSFSSTPTCTPARAALLTGMSPWNHGMLGYGTVAPFYPVEFPRVLGTLGGYTTASFGKDHFGWNSSDERGNDHGYQTTMLYDGLGSWNAHASNHWAGEFDEYDQWFERTLPGKDPQATLDGFDGDGWNGWHGRPYVYNETMHPTYWVGSHAVDFLTAQAAKATAGTSSKPFLAKVSFHRPHSPYDPPQRVLDAVKASDLPPYQLCKGATADPSAPKADDSGHGDNWCLRFRGETQKGDVSGCGPSNADAWCGLMPDANATLSRRAYAASIRFVDEQVGRIYDTLVSTKLLATTFIIFTADHGDGQGSMFHWRKGECFSSSSSSSSSSPFPSLSLSLSAILRHLLWLSRTTPQHRVFPYLFPLTSPPPPFLTSSLQGYPYEFSAHVPMLLRWPESWVPPTPVVLKRGTTIQAPLVSELRDVLHTVIDAAGLAAMSGVAPAGHYMAEDGKSLLCLLYDPTGLQDCAYPLNPGPWREWVDLEHSTCYNNTNHWSALTDGAMKYVYRAWKGDEQLFNLANDPAETTDLALLSSSQTTLLKWRARLVAQYVREGRGAVPGWLSADNKTLLVRTASTTYSPNYPHAPPPPPPAPLAVGAPITMKGNGGSATCNTNDCWKKSSTAGLLELISPSGFCVGGDATKLVLALCNATAAKRGWHAETLLPTPKPIEFALDFTQGKSGTLVATALGGLCLTADGGEGVLATCVTEEASQKFLWGASGRFCSSDGGCIHAGEK
tara:strand:- start:996 stop:3248 length:2253 start_codon:yes stop_codon:yes gene_type:complete